MSKTQLTLDFAPTKPSQSKGKKHSVNCLQCGLEIDLHQQREREVRGCPHCCDREWLLNLKTADACFLYNLDPKSLGGRLKDE